MTTEAADEVGLPISWTHRARWGSVSARPVRWRCLQVGDERRAESSIRCG